MPRVEFDDLVTAADIATRIGVSRQRVSQLAERPGFPPPVGRIGNYTIWRWTQVDRWSHRTRKTG